MLQLRDKTVVLEQDGVVQDWRTGESEVKFS